MEALTGILSLQMYLAMACTIGWCRMLHSDPTIAVLKYLISDKGHHFLSQPVLFQYTRQRSLNGYSRTVVNISGRILLLPGLLPVSIMLILNILKITGRTGLRLFLISHLQVLIIG